MAHYSITAKVFGVTGVLLLHLVTRYPHYQPPHMNLTLPEWGWKKKQYEITQMVTHPESLNYLFICTLSI